MFHDLINHLPLETRIQNLKKYYLIESIFDLKILNYLKKPLFENITDIT